MMCFFLLKATAPLMAQLSDSEPQEVKKISEFTTACYYEESVLKSEKITVGKTWFGVKTDDVVDAIVLTVKCKVRAGFDLSMLGDNDLIVANGLKRNGVRRYLFLLIIYL